MFQFRACVFYTAVHIISTYLHRYFILFLFLTILRNSYRTAFEKNMFVLRKKIPPDLIIIKTIYIFTCSVRTINIIYMYYCRWWTFYFEQFFMFIFIFYFNGDLMISTWTIKKGIIIKTKRFVNRPVNN